MSIRNHLFAALAAAGMLLSAGAAVQADDHGGDNHDQARALREHGEIHALRDVLRSIARDLEGDIVGLDLIQINDRWVYRVQIVDRDGRRRFLDVGAGTDIELDDDGDE